MLPKYNDIVDLIKKGSTIEAQEKILELRQAALDLQEENISLKEKIKGIEQKASVIDSLYYEPPFYWTKTGDKKDGPYCQKCQDADSKLIRLQHWETDMWICKQCDSRFCESS